MELDAKVWTVPAERMKGRREHRVPLSKRAVDILTAMPREAEYVFPGARKGEPMSNMAMLTLLRRMRRHDVTVHGFRSRPSATGRRSARPIPTTWPRLPWRTRWATRSRPPTAAVTCWPSALA